MNIQPIDCDKGHRYFVHVKVPSGDDMVAPTVAGEVTGLKARFRETKAGDVIHADLEDLDLTGHDEEVDLYYVDVNKEKHAHLKALGRGKRFLVIYSKENVADFQTDTFVVAHGSDI
jgi:hypothetical protein